MKNLPGWLEFMPHKYHVLFFTEINSFWTERFCTQQTGQTDPGYLLLYLGLLGSYSMLGFHDERQSGREMERLDWAQVFAPIPILGFLKADLSWKGLYNLQTLHFSFLWLMRGFGSWIRLLLHISFLQLIASPCLATVSRF